MVYGEELEPLSPKGSPRSKSVKGSTLLRRARVLGFETRNVANEWLQPLGLRNTSESSDAAMPLPTTLNTAGSSYHYSTVRNFVQLSPHYGPGQNSPKELACLRTTKSLQHLGRTAIFSQNPYVDSALETLLLPGQNTFPLGSMSPGDRRLSGKLPRKGARAAAMRRARMLVSQGASFHSEVPFADAMRVCNLAGDKSAMPALLHAYIFSKPRLPLAKLEYYVDVLSMQPPLIQLQAVAQLLQAGFFFAAIKLVYGDVELLRATLEEMKLLVEHGKNEAEPEIAAHTWSWQDVDKELFVKQFRELHIITYYMDLRKQLRAIKAQGAVALAHVEREMLTKVIVDFLAQVDVDSRAQKEQEAMLQAQNAMDAQRRAQEESRKAEQAQAAAEAKARAVAKARALADERKRVAEERARSYTEARKAAREAAEEELAGEAAAAAATAAATARLAKGQQGGGPSSCPEAAAAEELADAAMVLVMAAEEEREAQEGGEGEPAQLPEESAAAEESGLVEVKSSVMVEPSFVYMVEKPEEEGASAGAREGAEVVPAAPAGKGSKPPPKQPSASGAAAKATPLPAAAAAPSSASPSSCKVASLPPGSKPSSRQGSRQDSASRATEAAALAAADLAAELALALPQEEREARQAAAAIVRQALAAAVETAAASDAAAKIAATAIAKVLKAALDSKLGSRASSRASSPAAAGEEGTPTKLSSKPPSRLGSNKLEAMVALPSGTPPAALVRSPITSRPGSMRASGEPELGLSAADMAGLMSPMDSRPTTAGSVGREALDQGIAEMRRQLSEGRRVMEAAAEKLRASRPTTPAKAISNLTGEETAQGLTDALDAGCRSREEGEEAERQQLAALLSGSVTPQRFLEDQQQKLSEQLEEKLAVMNQLAAERENLRSAQSVRNASRAATPPSAKEVQDDKKLKEVEIKLAAEELAARNLEEQKAAIQEERERMEAEKKEMVVQSKAAMNEQITRTMRMFQEQLAQTVKMAAMLQAQRIMTGGMGPSMSTVAPTVNLPHEVDEPPTPEEITEYARYLGIDPETDPDLLYIAEWALTAPVPEGWTVHLDGDGHEFFHNNVTNQSIYEHPMDEHYRKFYEQKKAEKQGKL